MPTPTGADGRGERVLVLAPLGRDAAVVCETLGKAGLHCTVCGDMYDLCDKVAEGVGAALLTEEVLTPQGTSALSETLKVQPRWSDVPLVLFVDSARQGLEGNSTLQTLLPENATLLERPVRAPTLVTVTRSALRARRRQYEVRDLLARLEEANETLEARVETRVKEVRTLASELSLAEGRERSRLAQRLHDEVQQELFGVQFALRDAQAQAERLDEKPRQRLQDAYDLLRQCIATSRAITGDLSPPGLQGEGLAEVFGWLADHMRQRFGLSVEVKAPQELSTLPEGLQVLLFTVVRELLFNVVKHARSDRATVTLRESKGQLEVEVADKGRGFDPHKVESGVAKETGLGLASVRSRLAFFGGRLNVHSVPGDGSSFTVVLPTSSLP